MVHIRYTYMFVVYQIGFPLSMLPSVVCVCVCVCILTPCTLFISRFFMYMFMVSGLCLFMFIVHYAWTTVKRVCCSSPSLLSPPLPSPPLPSPLFLLSLPLSLHFRPLFLPFLYSSLPSLPSSLLPSVLILVCLPTCSPVVQSQRSQSRQAHRTSTGTLTMIGYLTTSTQVSDVLKIVVFVHEK